MQRHGWQDQTKSYDEVYIVTPTNILDEDYDDFDGITHDNQQCVKWNYHIAIKHNNKNKICQNKVDASDQKHLNVRYYICMSPWIQLPHMKFVHQKLFTT